ncbi:nicotinate phosphoribosyltransferase [Lentilactobacillus farraginis DSM 18382 = JCM 14108]|uniref:nicotinate phosphoribosyltransferase n=1 Tax=Lentilactobacillus farraginis DSM 18382 = JCM 14108 TaxID=1423743 RepID=X0PL46_9LACO|nr:nicotinate phosphoribosyltransferase [Lentilactobacillus farraginis DSM 18382 = JCM 14108]
MDNLSMLTDLYEFSMANGYRQTIDDEEGVFDIFFRKVPDNGSFVICAGLQQVVESLKDFHFSKRDVDYLRSLHLFKENFLEYLSNFHFQCQVSAIPEGTPVFPREPLLTIRGPLLQTQLFETLLLNIMNHQSLIATKARRITFAAGDKPVMEFGARRAQGPAVPLLVPGQLLLAVVQVLPTFYQRKSLVFRQPEQWLMLGLRRFQMN